MSMKNLNLLVKGMVSLLLGGLLVTSCQSEDFDGPVQAKGKGTVTLNLNAMSGFETETKADVDYTNYKNADNYTVTFTDMGGSEVSMKYSEWKQVVPYEFSNGSYTVKAYYGEEYKDAAASQKGFYVVGSQVIQVESGKETSVSLTCEPTCAKVITEFDATMATYYSDYYVEYTTKKTSVKSNDDPWYLLVDEGGETIEAKIVLTPKEGYQTGSIAELTQKYTLKPNQAWTLKISPNYTATDNKGSVSITITIDETTNDVEIPVVVPSDWTSGTNTEDTDNE